MSLAFLVNAYLLVAVLCLLQIGSGLAAIHLYGIGRGAIYLQIIPVLFGVVTLEKMYRMLKYTRRTDTTIFSRVHTHYVQLVYLAVPIWPICVFALSVVERQVIPPASTLCRANGFWIWQCIPLGMNVVLPYTLSITLFFTSQLLKRRARAIHGVENVPMPQPVPRPWLYADNKVVPAWMTPHVAEFETVPLEEGAGKSAVLA
ncbi:hypothetical protein C8R44DRAFT_361265 [Mycena epipterygia]|nr:hypothetical protein C8R44DRAFT_361265 [Mycena epipterygia]